MSAPLPPVLVVDDEKNMRLSFQTVLTDEGYEVRAVESAEEALELLAREEFFMVITDARLGGMSGYELLEKLHARKPELPALMITAYATPKLAVEAIKAGAIDYLAKPFAPEELLHAVARCAERHRLLRENAGSDRARNESFSSRDRGRIAENPRNPPNHPDRRADGSPRPDPWRKRHGQGTSRGRLAQFESTTRCALRPHQLRRYSRNAAGKRIVRPRKRRVHRRDEAKIGRVEEADGGTIFLDEIADMSRPLQAKLLRFLEDGSFTRVGGTQELRVNVRLIAATNRDIMQAIAEMNFAKTCSTDSTSCNSISRHCATAVRNFAAGRAFFEIVPRPINKHVNGLIHASRQKLLSHHWPGNVRELRNAIERAFILETTSEIQSPSLPDFQVETRLQKTSIPQVAADESLDDALARIERDLIHRAGAKSFQPDARR